ncbi:MAG: hypothetical protein EHM48_04125 [Planctomycetaceae bacterium]|nr:MAG: hypothetical protein EHM48_04125 [Planctomycetaceae bacterium]
MTRPPVYRNGAMLPDPERMATAHHIRRDPDTGEISWPPTRMDDILRQLGLINRKDDDNA